MILTKMDVLQSAMIGCNVMVDLKNNSKISGKLKSLSDEFLEIEDVTAIIKLCWKDVLILNIPNKLEERNSREAYSWWKKQHNFAINYGYSLGNCYRNIFDKIAENTTNVFLATIFKTYNTKKLITIDYKEENEFLKIVDAILKRLNTSCNERNAARALIYLAAKDYAKGLDELIQAISNSEDPKRLLPLICYYQDMSDGAGAFYWASSYYENSILVFEEQDGLWWNYLLQVVSFDYYDDIVNQLLDIYEISPLFAVKSLGFLFFARNDMYKGTMMIEESTKENIITKEQFYTYLGLLQYGKLYGEHYSYYARYCKWISLILSDEEPLYKSFEQDVGIYGFIYDFVPRQGYCKVLGIDLLSYFMHFDNCTIEDANNTKSIRNKLQKEICSMSSVEDELPVCIEFCRLGGIDSKKNYAITRAELVSQILT